MNRVVVIPCPRGLSIDGGTWVKATWESCHCYKTLHRALFCTDLGCART